jgi:hypothetical protein
MVRREYATHQPTRNTNQTQSFKPETTTIKDANAFDISQSTVCQNCSSLDLSDAVQRLGKLNLRMNQREGYTELSTDRSVIVANVGTRFRTPPKNNCPLCTLLHKTRSYDYPSDHQDQDDGDLLRAFPFFTSPRWPQAPKYNPAEAVILVVLRSGSPGISRLSMFLQLKGYLVVRINLSNSILAQVPKKISATFAHQPILQCLQDCKLNHPRCTKRMPEPIPLSLIDCDTRKIHFADSSHPYCALSYVWGGIPAGRLGPDGELPLDLARTIDDAIEVTKTLGYQYLWVDQFCVEQEDTALKTLQISNMATVYSEADLTLVAASGPNANYGLPGTALRPREFVPPLLLDGCTIIYHPGDITYAISESIWNTRGWTYQEGFLSRRLLYFHDSQTSYQCGESYYSESLGQWLWYDPGEWAPSQKFPEPVVSPGRGWMTNKWSQIDGTDASDYGMRHYQSCISSFRHKQLSFEKDTLFALAGIMEYSRSMWTQALLTGGKGAKSDGQTKVAFVQGIPHFVRSGKRPREPDHSLLVKGLLWRDTGNFQRRDQFPSWSWAGWVGSFSFGELDNGDPTLIQNVFLEQVVMKQRTWKSYTNKKHNRISNIERIASHLLFGSNEPISKEPRSVPINKSEQVETAGILVLEAYRLSPAAITGTPAIMDRPGTLSMVAVDIFGLKARVFTQDPEHTAVTGDRQVLSTDFFEKLSSGEYTMVVLAAPTQIRGTYGEFLIVHSTGDGYYERVGVAETVAAKDPEAYPEILSEDLINTRSWRETLDTRTFVDGIRRMCKTQKLLTWRLK